MLNKNINSNLSSSSGSFVSFSFHERMKSMYLNYHEHAKANPSYSLLNSLVVLEKFVKMDTNLNPAINQEIGMLKDLKIDNPYFQKNSVAEKKYDAF